MLNDFERYAGQQLGGTQRSTSVATFSPKFDVTEREKEYVLQGELPSVASENVEIEYTDGQTLVVRDHSERKHTEGDVALLEGHQETKNIEGGEDNKKEEHAATTKDKEGGDEGAKPKAIYWLSERSYGEFSRLHLPVPLRPNRVRANFKDGDLDISVPKAKKQGAKKIPIQ